jgi:WD repeat and SOF domain-containing protein 1
LYLDIQAKPPDTAYPPRPVPGSVADMDIVMDHCDFSTQKVRPQHFPARAPRIDTLCSRAQYVRDCLEVLRLGGGLDNDNRVRRGKMDEWKYIYSEVGAVQEPPTLSLAAWPQGGPSQSSWKFNYGLPKKSHVETEPTLKLPPPQTYQPYPTLQETCDPENPRVFHMFWAGPFTDKPYMALLSFLFTQNVRINLHEEQPDATVCRPQFWMWINPGPAAAVPNPSALHDMFEQLKSNAWASPFLHPRFKDVIKFRMWNTTEQLDGVPEIKEDWRMFKEDMFNSGGHIIPIPKKDVSVSEKVQSKDDDNMVNRVGSKSATSYDRLSVVLSDMARFVLCHRFGGIYLDADTIFLRDWEELWGWKGAFAYRWSRLENYNTAVLRMHRNSALGTFIFRTALKNGLDFHPMSITNYLKHAQLEGLLLRLPDALFDSAWLNTEDYQRNRPPQPFFMEYVGHPPVPRCDCRATI